MTPRGAAVTTTTATTTNNNRYGLSHQLRLALICQHDTRKNTTGVKTQVIVDLLRSFYITYVMRCIRYVVLGQNFVIPFRAENIN